MKEAMMMAALMEAMERIADKMLTTIREENKEQRTFMLALIEAGKEGALEGATKASQCHTTAANQATSKH